MKPIEPGCNAVLMKTGKPDIYPVGCHVVAYKNSPSQIGSCRICGRNDVWEISQHMPNGVYVTCECCLLRIDGYDPSTDRTTEKKRERV